MWYYRNWKVVWVRIDYIYCNCNCIKVCYKAVDIEASSRVFNIDTIRYEGLSSGILHNVFYAIIVSKLVYGISSWWSFFVKAQLTQINSFLIELLSVVMLNPSSLLKMGSYDDHLFQYSVLWKPLPASPFTYCQVYQLCIARSCHYNVFCLNCIERHLLILWFLATAINCVFMYPLITMSAVIRLRVICLSVRDV